MTADTGAIRGVPVTANRFCEELIQQLSGYITGAMECDHASAGYETIITPFLYPDRDNVELFVRPLTDGRVLISDLGQTMMKLSSYGFTPAANTPRRRAMIYQIVSSMNVQYERGEIVVIANAIESGERLWDVAMAVQRLSDLVYTVNGYTKATFSPVKVTPPLA